MSELGNETSALLRKARQGTPTLPPEVRTRLRGAVMAGAGLSTVAAGVSFAKVVLIGVVSASVGAVTTFVATRPPANAQVVVPSSPRVEPVVQEVAPLVPNEAPLASSSHDVTPERAEPRQVVVPAAPVLSLEVAEVLPEPRVDERSLAAELETVEGILRATDAEQWSDARLRLGAYFSRFEQGHLRVEARALEVLTLCGEGQREAAQSLRRELLSTEPLNPAVLRLASSCAAD